jgi:class 3 adenylate cyclase
MERRIVTAFFVDVVGSTALTARLGPERFKRTLDRAFLELRAIIEGESGTIANVIGDAIFALFGVPTAHPDDPQRALRAAQACIRWAEERNTALVPLAVRIGVETGEVIVDLVSAEREGHRTSIGNCVNLAARLQQHAEPGQIFVGPTCYEVTTEIATFASLGNVELKGLGSQTVWRLVALGGSFGCARPPLIGRDAEMANLKAAFQRIRLGKNMFAVVSGPTGQGKTRLVEEFLAEIAPDARILQARCRPASELSARSPLRELLAWDGGERSGESLADRLVDLFPDALERERVFTALAHSAGIIVGPELKALPAGQRQDEIENGWRRYLAALARDRPVVLWVDDVHWAEPETVRLVGRMTLGTTIPILVVLTARPEFGAPSELRTDSNRMFMGLDALDESDACSPPRGEH